MNFGLSPVLPVGRLSWVPGASGGKGTHHQIKSLCVCKQRKDLPLRCGAASHPARVLTFQVLLASLVLNSVSLLFPLRCLFEDPLLTGGEQN